MKKIKFTYKNPAHAFKSNSNNSKRSRKNAEKINNTKYEKINKRSKFRRNRKKTKKLAKLTTYPPEDVKPEIKLALENNKHVVFAGGELDDIPDHVQKVKVTKFHVTDLKIIDSNEGFRVVDKEGNVVATKVAREEALKDAPSGMFAALYKCLQNACENFTRGITRIVGLHSADGDKEAYFCRGFSTYRNKKGVYDKWNEKDTKSKDMVKKIKSLITFCDRKMRGHTHPVHLEGYEEIEGIMDSQRMGKNILASIAVGCGAYLNAHKDDDAFLSVITSHAEKECHYLPESKIVTYFCFPEQGYAIALRAGDILIFNSANELHCSSSLTSDFIEETVFNCSMYLKTNVLAGNNND